MIHSLTRRAALALAGFNATLWSTGAHAAIATPAQTAGPFYPPPRDRVGDEDWDLVKIEGRVREAGGEILHLFGQVFGLDGEPVENALVEIWQCDANGRYLHRDDRQDTPRDPDFQGYGAVLSDAEGAYRFRTIRPVSYPGRTPHIHARVVAPGRRELVTQLYMIDEPENQEDWIFRSLGAARQAAVSLDPARRGDGDLEAGFNFVV